MSGRPIGGTWPAAALAVAVLAPPWVPRPFRGGCGAAASLAGFRSFAGRGGGEGGGRGGGGGVPLSPCLVSRRPQAVAGGGAVVPVPRGQLLTGGAHFSPPPSTLWVPDPRAGLYSGPPLSLPGGGAASAGGGGPGQLSAVSGLRGSGLPPVLVVPALSLTGGGARPSAASYSGGGGGRAPGRGGAAGEVSRGTVPSPGPSRSSPGPAGCGCQLRRRLRGGWNCGASGFRQRYRHWVRALRKARPSQLLASASVMRSTAPPS